ncbi:hypothetical protein CANCADRAFT_147825 [Tortispora caseinolytica NRRL Y-17796]|uniref:Uncharacterized protein n=1 Tax=Tortispora caseinolytica NRRL Y-17796 TaxID=767744 RepID=A0A1E4TE70_9ASCO|nr:hypothetical protein CANCADRAFT_147825 [Tortispora caseinolytica NRRL Y-17796]
MTETRGRGVRNIQNEVPTGTNNNINVLEASEVPAETSRPSETTSLTRAEIQDLYSNSEEITTLENSNSEKLARSIRDSVQIALQGNQKKYVLDAESYGDVHFLLTNILGNANSSQGGLKISRWVDEDPYMEEHSIIATNGRRLPRNWRFIEHNEAKAVLLAIVAPSSLRKTLRQIMQRAFKNAYGAGHQAADDLIHQVLSFSIDYSNKTLRGVSEAVYKYVEMAGRINILNPALNYAVLYHLLEILPTNIPESGIVATMTEELDNAYKRNERAPPIQSITGRYFENARFNPERGNSTISRPLALHGNQPVSSYGISKNTKRKRGRSNRKH